MGKKPFAKNPPHTRKQPLGKPPEVEDKRPVWRLGDLDLEGPFSCKRVDAATLERIVRRLSEMESIPWHEMHKTGSHAIQINALHPTARQRLQDIRQDDVDELFSLRITGSARVFGIRDRWILRILWWDPDHGVCPSTLKHT